MASSWRPVLEAVVSGGSCIPVFARTDRSSRRQMRTPLAVALGICTMAGTCIRSESLGLAVPPSAGVAADSAAALAVVVHTARAFGLAREARPSFTGLHECYGDASLTLCWKGLDGEMQFYVHEVNRGEFTRRAGGLILQLTDSLQSRFGVGAVRQCEWGRHANGRIGCPPLVQRDSM